MSKATDPPVPVGVNPDVPSVARLYDYYLGGTTNYEADRAAGDQLRQLMPEVPDTAWANRGFHHRAARWMSERGIVQFLDIGSGLPTMTNTHEVVRPGSRVVYVDNDPQVAFQSAPLLAADRSAAMITADLRDVDGILHHRQVQEMIDFSEPVGLLMTAVLQFIADEEEPWAILRKYTGALAPGSYLAVSQVTGDAKPPAAVALCRQIYQDGAKTPIYPRTYAEMEFLFGDLDLVPPYDGAEPQVVHAGLWGADDPSRADSDGSQWMYAGVARIG